MGPFPRAVLHRPRDAPCVPGKRSPSVYSPSVAWSLFLSEILLDLAVFEVVFFFLPKDLLSESLSWHSRAHPEACGNLVQPGLGFGHLRNRGGPGKGSTAPPKNPGVRQLNWTVLGKVAMAGLPLPSDGKQAHAVLPSPSSSPCIFISACRERKCPCECVYLPPALLFLRLGEAQSQCWRLWGCSSASAHWDWDELVCVPTGCSDAP